MDKKLRKKLCDFLQCVCGETHCASIDYLGQAFRDAHWIEPQQPEKGELAPNPYECTCSEPRSEYDAPCELYHFYRSTLEAQRAHMIAQGYRKLPSAKRVEGIVRALNGREKGGGFLRIDVQVEMLREWLREEKHEAEMP